MPIRLLPETTVNRIAAGEVVERPASVVKELVENALDAGATRIAVATAGGGLSLIRVSDDGAGIPEDELALAVSRHCTSKLGDDIADIRSLGFRGEALPSIGSVSKLTLRSRTRQAQNGAEIRVEGGEVSVVRPAAGAQGTVVEARDLFFATPARLKFAKGERAEAAAVTDTLRRIALAFPQVRFTLSGPDRQTLEWPATDAGEDGRLARIAQVLGSEFPENAIALDAGREGVHLSGYISIPAYSRLTAQAQYFFVNGRPVRDRLIAGALKGAYADTLASGRHPVAALFLDLDPRDVDVNVHPAKADVRFRDPGLVRGLIVGGIREALGVSGIRPAGDRGAALAEAFRPAPTPPAWGERTRTGAGAFRAVRAPSFDPASSPQRPLEGWGGQGFGETAQATFLVAEPSADARAGALPPVADAEGSAHPLGAARAQVHANYIVAQTADSLVIVDQHAAHERLVYEALKEALQARPCPAQMLLLPEIVDLPEDDADRLGEHAETLGRFGLQLERFGPGAVAVRATPAMLGEVDAQRLVRDLADQLAEDEGPEALARRLNAVAAAMACHGSVRSGRLLKPDEMNALLRRMEAVPGSGTCNHGRPTYIELKLADIERLFGRR